MWNEPRKSYRSPQKSTTQGQRLSTTCLITPAKAQKSASKPRQCPLHFNEFSHVCLTCRKSICLRCVLTYCQQHTVRSETEALGPLRDELVRLQVAPKVQEIELKLQQSRQRQEYLQKKVLRLIESIEEHFDYINELLTKKKLQIIQYYDSQFQHYLEEHHDYDRDMQERVEWLRTYLKQDGVRLPTIEDIDALASLIKKTSATDAKQEKKVTKLLMGKDKIRIEKMWSEQNLEKVLFEIEHIPFRMESGRGEKGKKRVTTQNQTEHQPQSGFTKNNSNSRLPSGRKIMTPSA